MPTTTNGTLGSFGTVRRRAQATGWATAGLFVALASAAYPAHAEGTAPAGVRQIEALLASRDRTAIHAADLGRLQRAVTDFKTEMAWLIQEARVRSTQALAVQVVRVEQRRGRELKQQIERSEGADLARALTRFDQSFPLRELAPRGSRGGQATQTASQSVRTRLVALSVNLQTLSTVLGDEALPGINQMRGLLRKVEGLATPEMTDAKDALAQLPDYLYELVSGIPSFDSMSRQQANEAVDQYVARLDEVASKIPAPPNEQQLSELRMELQNITDDLKNKIEALESERLTNASSVRETAVQLSNGIGSETFKLLLLVFGAIFGLVMGMPVVYRNSPVAENLLKPEFLLQISTVFVLSATIIMLGSGGFIEKTQLPTLLAGISGYVLGQLGRVGRDQTLSAQVPPKGKEA